jgi:hypothetical protein
VKYPWYRRAGSGEPLTQGDLISGVPVPVFLPLQSIGDSQKEMAAQLPSCVAIETQDVIVMTQACDLENNHVAAVQLCPTESLSSFRKRWETGRAALAQRPTEKAWNSLYEQMRKGWQWNHCLLNAFGEGDLTSGPFVVDFHKIFSLPTDFTRKWLEKEANGRLQLCSPYVEHLSQAFARYFMRVGLPEAIQGK